MAGDFKIESQSNFSTENEEDQRSIILSAFEKVFDEDCTYLKNMK